jgi:hypothetical protein
MEKPFKELRFTRSRQAVTFVIAGIIFLCAAAGVLILGWQRLSALPSVWWALIPITGAWASFRIAVHLARHAYLLLSPIGIEVFPFFRPAQNMRLFTWGEIQHAEVSGDLRLLTLNLPGEAKVFISLDPLKPAARPLLAKAIAGVMEKKVSPPGI